MTTSMEYLEAAKIEELATQLQKEGFQVVVHPSGSDTGYDLIAIKGDKRIAVEVKTNNQLKSSAKAIKELRERAIAQGFDEFRLVVVNPPHEATIIIEGLEIELYLYLTQNPPGELTELSSQYLPVKFNGVNRVSNLEIDFIKVFREGIHVIGSGVVQVEIDVDEPDANSFYSEFPFTFDTMLNHNAQIAEVHRLKIDTSSFSEA